MSNTEGSIKSSASASGGVQSGWTVVVLLSLLYAVSSVDRLILSLLVVPIKQELLVTDTQIGFLFGLSFALLYTLSGLPIARLADRGNRKWLIITGVCLWSACTVASAFAWDYNSLLACRAGVAIGEAVLTPAAISLIADLFPANRRLTPTAVYTSVGTVTGMTAAAIGAAFLTLATLLSPSFGEMPPWRLTLVLVGLPGVLIALIFAFATAEPERGQSTVVVTDTIKTAIKGELLSHLRAHGYFYAALFGAVGLSVTIAYSLIGWVPTLLTRKFALEPVHAGYLFGVIGAIAGAIGTLGTPQLLSLLKKAGRTDGILIAALLMCIVATPSVIVAALAPTLTIFVIGLSIAMIALPGLTLLPSLVVQQLSPARQRAQLVAIFLLISNLLGLGVGPTLTGFLTDTFFKDNGSTGASLAAMSIVALPLAALIIVSSRGAYRRLQALDVA